MNTQKYITNAKKEIEGPHKEWVDDLLVRMSRGGTIFEIGSATGRDADYIEKMNPKITVTRSDKEVGFVEHIKNTGKEAVISDILQDTFDNNTYTSFYFHMVINHFTLEEVSHVLHTIRPAVEKNGYISISFPLGDNSTLTEWNNVQGNIFCRYHSIQEIVNISTILGIHFVYLNETEDKKMCYVTFQV